MMFRGYDRPSPTASRSRSPWAAHGMSVVEVKERSRHRQADAGDFGTATTAASPRHASSCSPGPPRAALLRTTADPTGTRCSARSTTAPAASPRGARSSPARRTSTSTSPTRDRPPTRARPAQALRRRAPAPRRAQVGARSTSASTCARNPTRRNRFGWVVEIDPYDPDSTPRKHTALGRFKHEGANVTSPTTARSSPTWATTSASTTCTSSSRSKQMKTATAPRRPRAQPDPARRRARSTSPSSPATPRPPRSTAPASCPPTASSTAPASGSRWRPATTVASCDGMTAEEVCVFTRLAGDKVGATKMDRPEDVEPNPRTGKVYVALTNNTNRGKAGKAARRRGQPAQRATSTARSSSSPSDGDHTGADVRLGRCCWSAATRTTRHLLRRLRQDQGQPDLLPGQRGLRPARQPVDLHRRQRARAPTTACSASPRRARTAARPSSSSPCRTGAETCGPIVTRTAASWSRCSTPARSTAPPPTTPASHWPDGGTSQPRPAVAVVWKKNGGRIGI